MEGCALGEVFYANVSKTVAVRRAMQDRQDKSFMARAKHHGINPETVAEWRSRTNAADIRTDTKHAHLTVRSIEEDALIGALRKRIFLPLDDCLYRCKRRSRI